MDLRVKLVEDVKFRELCVKMCKELGISASEWNKNKIDICLFIANQFIGLFMLKAEQLDNISQSIKTTGRGIRQTSILIYYFFLNLIYYEKSI
jgi:hypothetical protein